MYRIGQNGTKYYAVYAEYGPYRNVMDAMREAERLNEASGRSGKRPEEDRIQGVFGPPTKNGKAYLV